MFNNFNDIHFHIIKRSNIPNYNKPNIYTYENCSQQIMTNILLSSNYVLFIKNCKDHIDKVISGALPMAFTFNCQAIIPKEWNKYYNFKSCIIYDDNEKITLTNEINYDNINEELLKLIEDRNSTIDNIFNKHFYKLTFKNNPSPSKFIKVLRKNNITKPNIFVNYNDNNFINEIINEFRSIYLINIDIDRIHNYVNSKNIFFSIQNLTDFIKSPALFYLDNYQRLIQLNKRTQNDVIIINNYNPEQMEEINKIYDRYFYKIEHNKYNWLILVPFM